MKKIFSFVILTMVAVLLFGCGEDKAVLKVYNAGEYIDTALISDFENEHNCKIVYETFDSNESMYTKVMSGERYDVIIPSDYMIERLAKEGFLQEVDKTRLENYGQIMENLLSQPFDAENKYSVPYFWGSVGILYDKTRVNEADLKEGWEILKNTKYADDIYMYDSERDSFMIALKSLGYSLNTSNIAELDAAYNWLVEQNEIMNPVYVGDEVIDSMITGNKAMAIVYSGDAAYIMSENENMRYFEPQQGTNLWIDGMVIMKESQNPDLAHEFIDFMLRPENAKSNSEMVGYTSPIKSVFDELYGTTYKGNDAYMPRQNYSNDEFFRYQDADTKRYCAELWTKVKSQ
jgi:spermidine/putrescine transport system permease protein